MKKLNISFLVLLFTLSSFSQNNAAELGVGAIGLVVSDIAASEKFYTEVLGMIPAGSFELSPEWSVEAGASNGRPFKVKMFRMVDQNSATVLKLAYFDSIAPRPEQNGIDVNAGVNYLTFSYSDLQPVADRLERAGVEQLGWVKRDEYQLIFIRDPDGVFVELIGPPAE